jgi:16S rRNA (adenine1518-N6/adenine1519-N6)-dimethyltransferase
MATDSNPVRGRPAADRGGNRAKALGVQPRKSLGQNFLVDDSTSRRIVDAAGIEPGDLVIEIGPGLGALTRIIADRAAQVIAIELDPALIPHLQSELGARANVQILHADALKADYPALVADRPARVIANLPYYITSHAIRTLLECGVQWRSLVLTVQMEVAQRIIAQPPHMSTLAVSVQFYGTPELVLKLPPSAFYPQPSVDSATLRITPKSTPKTALQTGEKEPEADEFFRWVKAGFSSPRKQIRNNIAAQLGISKGVTEDILIETGITPDRRAETLTLQEWIALVKTARSKQLQINPKDPSEKRS